VTGRIARIVPFLEFNPPEQAVVAHKAVRDLAHRIRQPIVVGGPTPDLIGHCNLAMYNDAAACAAIARHGYLRATGARSLVNAVQRCVDLPLLERYWDTDELVSEEDNKGQRCRFVACLAGGGRDGMDGSEKVAVVFERE
jgi:ATP-dependent Clp protease ATP-binding subunit ClpA